MEPKDDDKTREPDDSGDDGADGGSDRKGMVPGAALRREADARKAAEKKAREAEARIRELEGKGQTEIEKIRAELDSLKPAGEKLRQYQELLTERADTALEALPAEARKKLKPTLERLTDPLDRLAVIESLASLTPKQPQDPNVDRNRPAPNTDPEAPKTYGDWLAIRDPVKRAKYRDLAVSLPE